MSHPRNSTKHTRIRIAFGIAGLIVLCASSLVFRQYLIAGSNPSQVDTIQNAIDLSASYLVSSTKEDGMFEYRVNMDPTITVSPRYNILRHGGTIYAMSMYYQLEPDDEIRSAIERAGRYLRDESIYPVAGQNNMLAVWSDPEVNGTGNPLEAKLGGTGLGLVALLSIEEFHPGFTPLADLQALGRFIIYMQKDDGSFYSKYIPSEGGRNDEWQSLYYPGEAALGLLMLYEKDPSILWLESAYKALEYLALSRENSTDIPSDHWALLATEKILSLENSSELYVSRELLISHAIQICESILEDQIDDPQQPIIDGGFSIDGRTTPTATRLEGLQAALSFLPTNHEMRQRINRAVQRGITFLLQSQVRKGEYAGAFPRAVVWLEGNTQEVEDFNNRATEVRIDYVQHAMSAMIQYLKVLNPS